MEEGRIAIFLLKFLFKTVIKVILSMPIHPRLNLKYNKKVCNVFQSDERKKNKGRVDEAFCHVVYIE